MLRYGYANDGHGGRSGEDSLRRRAGCGHRPGSARRHRRSPRGQGRGLAVVLRVGLLPGGRSGGRDGLCAGPDDPVEGGHFGGGVAGAHPVLVAKQLASLAASRRSGFFPSSVCVRRFRPSARCSWSPTASAQRCSMSRCGCCARRWSTTRPAISRPVFHRQRGRRRPAAGASAGHLVGRLGAGGVSAHRHAGRRLVGQFPHPGRGAGGARGDRTGRRRRPAGRSNPITSASRWPSPTGSCRRVGRGGTPASSGRRSRRADRRRLGPAAPATRRLHRGGIDEVRHPAGRQSAAGRLPRSVRHRTGRPPELERTATPFAYRSGLEAAEWLP